MKRILTVVGARPQFVKAAVVSSAIRALATRLSETLVHTGQHYDANMSDVFFQELGIPDPHIHLGIGGGTHGQNTGRMIEALESVMVDQCPDVVLIYGDTDSTLAGAMAACKLRVPIAHVEAGLRSFNRLMPEEINRVLADHVADVLFTPTSTATANLQREGIRADRIFQVGDVMLDAAMHFRELARAPAEHHLEPGFILATVHRAENTEDPTRLRSILAALEQLARHTPVIAPLHPRTRKLLSRYKIDTGGIIILEPVGYLEMSWLLQHCSVVVSDSGGVQKEAYFFGKPCITTREETEWIELIGLGQNVLVGASQERIMQAVRTTLATSPDCGGAQHCDGQRHIEDKQPFGGGDAGRLIAEHLIAI